MKRTARREEENSGLIDLDALLREMREAQTLDRNLRVTAAPLRRRRPAVVAMVLLSVGGNALALANAAASTFSARRKSDAPVASARPAVAPLLPATERPRAQRGSSIVRSEAGERVVRLYPAEAPEHPDDRGEPSYVPRHAVPPPPNPAPSVPDLVATVTVPTEAPKPTLDEAMRSAVGQLAPTVGPPRAVVVATADARNESAVQLHPAPGAVLVALGAAQVVARRCLTAEDPFRTYEVVFGNDGHVARVLGPAEDEKGSCIRGALGQARVAPFVEESYRTRITIRP